MLIPLITLNLHFDAETSLLLWVHSHTCRQALCCRKALLFKRCGCFLKTVLLLLFRRTCNGLSPCDMMVGDFECALEWKGDLLSPQEGTKCLEILKMLTAVGYKKVKAQVSFGLWVLKNSASRDKKKGKWQNSHVAWTKWDLESVLLPDTVT